MPSPLDAILDAAREALRGKRSDVRERADRIKAAADAYVAAFEHEIALEFAAKNGLPAPVAPAASIVRAALDLRAAVEQIPELRVRHEPAPSAEPAPSKPEPVEAKPAVVEEPPPSPPPPTPAPSSTGPVIVRREIREEPASARSEQRREVRGNLDPDPDIVALTRDMHSLNFDSMPLQLFRAWAEELAARARGLQGKGPDGEELAGRVIRRLTAIAYEKGVADIYGLNRKHTGNWTELANRARARREAILRPAPKPAPVDPKVAEAKEAEAKAKEAEAKVKEAEAKAKEAEAKAKAEEDESVRLPLLSAACERGPVVMVGGIVKQDKVQAIRDRFGIDVEWIDTSRSGNHAIGSIEKRIREKRLAAVVVLQGLISHKHFEPLVGAARQVSLPFAYADKAGTGSVGRAFAEIEKALARKDEERAATT